MPERVWTSPPTTISGNESGMLHLALLTGTGKGGLFNTILSLSPFCSFLTPNTNFETKTLARPHHTWKAQPYHQLQKIGQEKEIQEGGGRTPLIQNGRQGPVLALLTGKSWGILSSPLSLWAGERRKWNDQKVAYKWLVTFESKQSFLILLSATLWSPLPP